jgi:hypothetical protein
VPYTGIPPLVLRGIGPTLADGTSLPVEKRRRIGETA